jgi:hypothetical protein
MNQTPLCTPGQSMIEDKEGIDPNTGEDYRNLYSSTAVARIFAVSAKTVARWASKKNFERHGVEVLYTVGGQMRFRKEEINGLYWRMVEQGGLDENPDD